MTIEPENEAERLLLEKAQSGERTDVSELPDPTVRADLLYDLCVHPDDRGVDPKGIQLEGARVTGQLDLEGTTVVRPVWLWKCHFEAPIILRDARTRTVGLQGSTVPRISADRLRLEGMLSLRQVMIEGEVRLAGANINGNFECGAATLENPGGNALSADGITVTGSVILDGGFAAKGEVRLVGATIGGELSCHAATFENPGGSALTADRIMVNGSVFLDRGFAAKGEVRLPGGTIGAELSCQAATFDNPEKYALILDRINVGGNVSLDGDFAAKGEVRLPSAKIGASLLCSGATVENPKGPALIADNAIVRENVVFDEGFTAKGEVRLRSAEIGGDVSCVGANLENPQGFAFNADALSVRGDVVLAVGFVARGEVRLFGAQIDGDFVCVNATFDPGSPEATAFNATRMNVLGQFLWRLERAPVGLVNFDHAHVGRLVDNARSWPAPGNLDLDGFTYDSVAWNGEEAWRERRRWLELQRGKDFRPQPYEQLVAVLRRMGHERDARQIAIAKQDAYLNRGDPSRRRRLWMRFLRATIRYGYEPWRALGYMAFAVGFAWMVFSNAYHYGVMHPSKERVYLHDCYTGEASSCTGWTNFDRRWSKEPIQLPADYPEFNSFVYSVDTFLPIVDLHQENYWLPRGDGDWGWFFRLYLWLHIAVGWLLSTVAVFGLTGIIKKD